MSDFADSPAAQKMIREIYESGGTPAIKPALLPIAEAVPDEAIRLSFIAANVGPVSQALQHYTDDLLYHEVWLPPGLAPRERNLATVATLIATGQTEFLPFYLNRAVEEGISKAQIAEMLTHLAFYAGWPVVISAPGSRRGSSPTDQRSRRRDLRPSERSPRALPMTVNPAE
jgi:4-carboxymuconolactone decarboxylase